MSEMALPPVAGSISGTAEDDAKTDILNVELLKEIQEEPESGLTQLPLTNPSPVWVVVFTTLQERAPGIGPNSSTTLLKTFPLATTA